jgi:predicted regulator of Ras-like GTPase activity (Roadblock/LC7/MglB family)
MTHELDTVVARLARHQGVMGAMLVGIDDGMVIAGDAGPGRNADTAAALRLEADRGHLCATARGDVVIVAVASNGINLGKLRLEMLSAAETL